MKIAGIDIKKGENTTITLSIAKLTSGTPIEVPVFINRGKKDGPVLLLMAGLHGDEINAIDVMRSIIDEKHYQVDKGTVICVPILNIFGFINFSREVPDGKDVNRSFPGHSKGSLASQIAYQLTNKILPHCDYIIDLHTGGKSRFNVPQTRAVLTNDACKQLALAFNAPFTLHSNVIPKSLRQTALKKDKVIIVYEGGEALRFDAQATHVAIEGIKKVLHYLGMKSYNHTPVQTIINHHRKWLRAPKSGFFHPTITVGEAVKQGDTVGHICGAFADYKNDCIAPKTGHIVTLNNNPMVNRGDAIMQIAFD